MRITAAATAIALLAAACGLSDISGPTSAEETPPMMAAALVELILKDNTFGGGPEPFSIFLIQDHTDPRAGDVTADEGNESRPLTDGEMEAIEAAIGVHGKVQWIEDADDWRTDQLAPKVDGSVILGVGEPLVEEDTGLVPVSLWCGGLCGTWLTYRLDKVDGIWEVSGIEGPVTIS